MAENDGVYLIVGLGNPGPRYENTPHNAGWEVLDALTRQARFSSWRTWRSKSVVAEGRIGETDVILAKPTTYMNLSGEAVSPLVAHYEIPLTGLLVVCDDIALPIGRIRIRPGGSSGGQKGLQSIIDVLDSVEFARLRLGVAPDESGLPCAAERWVLSKWSPERREHFNLVIEKAVECVEFALREGVEKTMSAFNGLRVESPQELEKRERNA